MEWVVTSGRTIEEATEAALDQLGVDEQDAEVEVIQDAQKGLFGRLRAEAQVRARVRPTAPRPKVDRRERRRGDRRRDGSRGKGQGRERVKAASGGGADRNGRGERGGTPPGGTAAPADGETDLADDGEARQDSDTGRQTGSSNSRRRRRSRTPRTAEGATVSEGAQSTERPEVAEADLEEQKRAVESFLNELVTAFGRSDATVAVTLAEDQAIEASVDGSELGLLVGQKGVTLQAVQELVRSMVQRQFVGQSHARVRVDVAGYRARRKEALERFATGVAESVLESGVAKALDPMGSADRKVVHDTVNAIDGVVTASEGEDDARRVVIRPA